MQDAKVEAEHLKDDRIREAVLRERGVAPDSARQYMAELQASVKVWELAEIALIVLRLALPRRVRSHVLIL